MKQRFDELEGYRGLAALCIVVFHVYQYSGQGLGLPSPVYEGTPLHALFSGMHMSGVFFTLSGFLLFLPFVRAALAQDGQRSLRSFFIRRVIRILPLYYLVFLFVWAWRFQYYPGQTADLLLHLTFTQTFHPSYIFWTLGPTWSLAVEMQFCLFLIGFGPLIYWLSGKLTHVRQRQFLIGGMIAALIIGSIMFKWWAFRNPELAALHYFYSLPAKFDILATGMLLALLVSSVRSQPVLNAPITWVFRSVGLTLIAGAVLLDTLNPLVHVYHSTIIGVGTMLLIASTVLRARGSAWERVLQFPALRFIGSISYGVFLLHEPLMIEFGRAGLLISPAPAAFPINALILIGLSILAATISYHLIEQPFMELRHLFNEKGHFVERYNTAIEPSTRIQQPTSEPSKRIVYSGRG